MFSGSAIMAKASSRAIHSAEAAGGEVADRLMHAVASLRHEIASMANAVNDFGAPRVRDLQHDLQHNASALAQDLQRHLPVVARKVSRQAGVASRAVVNDPVPAIVVVGTLALLTSLFLRRSE
jgi:hypothetical protein